MKKISTIILFHLVLFSLFTFTGESMAKTDLSIAETDVTFSKTSPLEGDLIRVYARVLNSGDNDVAGYVVFLANGKEIANNQAISLKPNTYDDVFVDWKVKAGTYNIEAKIIDLNPTDENSINNSTTKKDIFIDADTDKDGIGDIQDSDKDGDELTNEEEITKGTNPLVSDTDGDKVNDKIDAFGTDKTEWRDTDGDTLGDNKDLDIDGDGLTNQDETIEYGSNPLTPDSDNDGFNDGQEIQAHTNTNKPDTDGDGTIDSKDEFPLDKNRTGASLLNSLTAGLFNSGNYSYLIFLAPIALIILFFFFRRKRR